jgi:hypothetical protein
MNNYGVWTGGAPCGGTTPSRLRRATPPKRGIYEGQPPPLASGTPFYGRGLFWLDEGCGRGRAGFKPAPIRPASNPKSPLRARRGCLRRGGGCPRAMRGASIPLLGGVARSAGVVPRAVRGATLVLPSKAPLFRGGCRLSGGGCLVYRVTIRARRGVRNPGEVSLAPTERVRCNGVVSRHTRAPRNANKNKREAIASRFVYTLS